MKLLWKHMIGAFALSLPIYGWDVSTAKAALEVCNETETPRSVAVAYKDGDDWRSEGWWNIDVKECKDVVKGELEQRYYYYRATHKGKEVRSGDYSFCSTSKVFDINGAEDCESRGFETTSFRVIDTGTSAKEFKFTLKFKIPEKKAEAKRVAKKQEDTAPKRKSQAAAKPKPKPAPAKEMTKAPRFTTDPFTAGSLGEPYTVIGVFQGCDNIDGWDHCGYHAEGWLHGAEWGGGTPDNIMNALEKMKPGTRFQVRGDMKSYGDITAEVAIRQIEPVEAGPHDKIIDALQGFWESDRDSAEYFQIVGSEQRTFYDGNLNGNGYIRWAGNCEGALVDEGTYMIVTDPESREDSPCFAVFLDDPNHLSLLFIGGTGQFQEYTRQR